MSLKPVSLKIEHTRSPGGCRIKLTGVIDESFDKERLVTNVDGVVVIDLDGVTRITSYGVREWISALQQLKSNWLGFVNCRPAMVSQFNMVSGFAGRGHILTLYLPYLSPGSGDSFDVKVDLRRHWAELAAFRPPPVQCPDDPATPAEFDDVPEAYLSFVASQPAPDPPPLVDKLLSDSGEPTGSLRIRKDVVGNVTGLWLSGPLDEKDHFKRLIDGLEGTLFVSAGGLTFGSEEGLFRLLNFLRNVSVPLVLGDLPLGLADRIAADAVLAQTAVVCSLMLPGQCDEHGAVVQSVDAGAIAKAFGGTPLLLFCPACNRICAHGFKLRELSNLAVLNTQPMSAEVKAVVDAHETKESETTETSRTMPGIPSPHSNTLMDRYHIVRPLGAGGMAEVFLARQAGDGGFERMVVVKRILPGLATDKEFVEMFLQEAKVAARLSHPNVVQIFDVCRDAGQYFMVMELVSGWDLNTILKASMRLRQAFPPQLAARITADIARGLAAAHTYTDPSGKLSPIIHRDVSPHNVLVSNQGHVKLTDFGIAKAADSLSRTPTSYLKGKAAYLAPELVQNTSAAPDPRMDLFAAGVVFYQLLTLVHPFRRDNDMATFQALVHEDPPPPTKMAPGLPPVVDAICMRAMAKNPLQRYQTARQLERDLESLVVASGGTVTSSDLASWVSSIPELGLSANPNDKPSATPRGR